MIKKALTNCPPITYNGERSAIPKREYYLSSPVGNRLFDLALGPVALALCARRMLGELPPRTAICSPQVVQGA